ESAATCVPTSFLRAERCRTRRACGSLTPARSASQGRSCSRLRFGLVGSCPPALANSQLTLFFVHILITLLSTLNLSAPCFGGEGAECDSEKTATATGRPQGLRRPALFRSGHDAKSEVDPGRFPHPHPAPDRARRRPGH